MIRTQIQLTDDQARRLRKRARQQGVSLAELIRRCVDEGLRAETPDRGVFYARAARLAGRFPDRDSASDLSREHDRYLEDAFS